jgi:2-deoxy-D-gluconate 3-dehydrogenase
VGKATAALFLKEGANVVIAGRDAAKLAAALAELNAPMHAVAVATDVTEHHQCERLVAEATARFGRVDILVNNAGTNIRNRPELTRMEDWHTVLSTNLTSGMIAAQAAYPWLKQGGVGRVINNGSMLSIFGLPFHAAYGASKGGVVQMTKSMAVAWAADGITVNVILPGWIDTELTRKARADMANLNEDVLRRSPVKRWGTPGDFEGVAAFLASDAAAFITGVAIPVDGGFSVHG